MKVIKVLETYKDGTSLAIVTPSVIMPNPIFKTNKQTIGHHYKDKESPEAIISKDINITLMACDVDEVNGVGLFQAADQSGVVVNTYISLDDVDWIEGNLGVDEKL